MSASCRAGPARDQQIDRKIDAGGASPFHVDTPRPPGTADFERRTELNEPRPPRPAPRGSNREVSPGSDCKPWLRKDHQVAHDADLQCRRAHLNMRLTVDTSRAAPLGLSRFFRRALAQSVSKGFAARENFPLSQIGGKRSSSFRASDSEEATAGSRLSGIFFQTCAPPLAAASRSSKRPGRLPSPGFADENGL